MPWGPGDEAVVQTRQSAGSLKPRRGFPLEPTGSRAMAGDGTGGGCRLPDSPAVPSSRLRRALRNARQALTRSEQRDHARRLARHLTKSVRFRRARRVALYWPADGEIDPRLLIDRDRGRQWFLPVLRRYPRKTLFFARWRPGEPLVPNRFGIPEPKRQGCRRRMALSLDLILVPLVGFDDEGQRLGMGGGFYDRTLARLRRCRHWRRPCLIGAAHACQRVTRLRSRPWDVRLAAVMTEEGPRGRDRI